VIRVEPHDADRRGSRRAWADGDFISEYRKFRPMVERSISWLVKDHYRRVRYRGVERNQLGLSTRVAAINLRRLVNMGLDFDGQWRLGVT
jgi:IS5 family transposase